MKEKMKEVQHVAIDVQVPAGVLEENKFGIKRLEGEDVATGELHKFMKKLDEVPGEPFKPRPVTIFRFPTWFHEINKDLCEPRIVSIGPYHHGKESLLSMEEHKWSTLRDFLARNENLGFEVYFREMRLEEARVRECYSETVHMESNDFIMMLLLDGCFILELLLKAQSNQWDTLCFVSWIECDIFTDLCLLENQIPFFVIHKLIAIQGRCSQNCQDFCPLLDLIYEIGTWPDMLFQFQPPILSCIEVHHFLHLYYTGVLPRIQLEREQSDSFTGSEQINIPCITELHEAGVKFRRKRSHRHMFDISFKDGIMEMPLLQIDTNIKSYFLNMVAFEQSRPPGPERIMSSYLALMDSLINTEKDVAILERSGIIENFLQNEEQAAKFFNQCGDLSVLSYNDHYFYGLYKNVQRYSKSTWHKYRARLMHDYFSNPWSSISVVAASILLILTFLQTYYSAKSNK